MILPEASVPESVPEAQHPALLNCIIKWNGAQSYRSSSILRLMSDYSKPNKYKNPKHPPVFSCFCPFFSSYHIKN